MKKKAHPLLKAEKKVDNYVWNTSAYLGSGPSGQIYKGIDLRTHSAVAIKIVEIEDLPTIMKISSLNEEITFLKKIQNPLLVPIFDIFLNKRHLYVIEEYCHQGDLRKCLSYNRGPLNESLILSLFKQIVSGIQALQSLDCSNCNLKPENIMILSGKDTKAIKITDFWIPRVAKFLKIRKTMGFGIYNSPQLLKEIPFTNKCEIWSLGLMLYEIVFGKLPWNGLNKKELMENIKGTPLKFPFRVEMSHALKNILKGCLQYEEINRFSLKEVLKHQDFLKEIIEKKARFPNFDEKTSEVLKKLQILINQQNIQLEKLYQTPPPQKESTKEDGGQDNNEEVPSEPIQRRFLYFKDFALIINVLDPSMKFEEIELFYEGIDPYKAGVSIEDLKELLFEKDFSEFEGYEDPFFEEKSERVTYILRETILRNKIDVEKLFRLFDVCGNNELSFEEFERLLLTIHPIISHEESNYLFQKLDYDKSGDINLNEFKAYVLRDAKLEEKLKQSENKYHDMRKEFKRLIVNQKVKPEKVFEKFRKENENTIKLDGTSKFLKVLDPRIQEEEAEYIFQRVDVERVGFLTKERFITGFLD